ncbi:MAG TPA: hypothetical protein VMJ66_07535 [Geobacteraceae bacterium]|nr:hypothetical protein [Geobacteraceae bacterium]
MKGIAMMAMAALLASAIPVFAQTVQEEETCAISANNCLNRAEMLEKRIKKMRAEMKRCTVQHSPEEMKQLEQKLQEAIDQLDRMEGKK